MIPIKLTLCPSNSPDVLERRHDVGAEGVSALRDAGEDEAAEPLAVPRQELVESFLRQVVAQFQVQADQGLQVAPLCPCLQDLRREGG